jgi:hypothetical protein
MQELMFLSIDLDRRRVVPFLPQARAALLAAAASHAHLPPSAWAGRRLAMPNRK